MGITKSLAMQQKARNLIPGMSQLLSKRPDMFAPGKWPGYYTKAEGVKVWDLDGNEYIDMSISGIGANILGYADPDVDAAVRQAIENGSSSTLNCVEEVELAELLCDLHPWAQKCRFARTGGESMAIAIRIARAYTGKDKIAFCGYHGWHDWYLAANLSRDNALEEHLLPGLSPRGVPKNLAGTAFPFRYNQINELKKIAHEHKNDLGVIVMEPIRHVQPDPDFFDQVRAIADEVGAVFLIDEISAGFRINTGGAHLTLGINPDIAVFSKALGNGYPIGAVIGKSEIMEMSQESFISSTMWTERIGPVAALATINKHRSVNAADHLIEIGNLIQQGWREQARETGLNITVQGIPPLSHFIFNDEQPQKLKTIFVQEMLERGYLASNLFYAMYAHQQEHVQGYLEAVRGAFSVVSDAIGKNNIDEKLDGEPATSGFKRLT